MTEPPVAWVIGGTSGIGAACADLLEARGRNVFRSGELSADVTIWSQIEEYAKELLQITGQNLHEVVYSAGINQLDWLGNMGPVHDYTQVLDVNLAGFVRLCDVLSKWSVEDIRIVVIGSDAAERPLRTSMLYCASKAGLHMAARVAAREKADEGWRVNVVAPGMTDSTAMTEYIDDVVPALRGWTSEEAMKYELQQGVVKRRADPREIAEVVVSTLEGPSYLNGSIITVNGGR